MGARTVVVSVIVALGTASLGGCVGSLRPLDDPRRWAEGECLARYVVDDERSPWAERFELDGSSPAPQARLPAAVIDPAAQLPVGATSAFRWHGRPIAWFTATFDVVVDGLAFAPLRRVDAMVGARAEPQRVGRITPEAREALGDRAVVEFLLRLGAIATYEVKGAALCLRAESDSDGAHRAELVGAHQYAGGGKVEQRYAFAVRIDPQGEIFVLGRDPPAP